MKILNVQLFVLKIKILGRKFSINLAHTDKMHEIAVLWKIAKIQPSECLSFGTN